MRRHPFAVTYRVIDRVTRRSRKARLLVRSEEVAERAAEIARKYPQDFSDVRVVRR